MHYLNANKTAGEKARRQLHTSAASNIEQERGSGISVLAARHNYAVLWNKLCSSEYYISGNVFSVTVIVIVNRFGETSLNRGRDCILLQANVLGKDTNFFVWKGHKGIDESCRGGVMVLVEKISDNFRINLNQISEDAKKKNQ